MIQRQHAASLDGTPIAPSEAASDKRSGFTAKTNQLSKTMLPDCHVQQHGSLALDHVKASYEFSNVFHSSVSQNGLPMGLLGLFGTGLENTPTGGSPRNPLACLALIACVSRARGGLRRPPFCAACRSSSVGVEVSVSSANSFFFSDSNSCTSFRWPMSISSRVSQSDC